MVRRPLVSLLCLAWFVACGSDDAGPHADEVNGAARDGGTVKSDGGPGPTGNADTGDPSLAADSLVGLWDVAGTDARGTYAGEIEIRSVPAGGYTFIRNVRYAGVTVEDGRELHWLFRGKITKTGDQASLEASLKRLDFINQRGSVTRTAADVPIPLKATFAVADEIKTTITGEGISLADTWRSRKALPATPIFEDKRTWLPAHDPESSVEIQTKFAVYSNYHGLDVIKPYVGRPDFKAAVHGTIIDPTDLGFYRQNPNVLRVVDKPIDDVSLGETRARADAFRYTLGKKAELYDKDVEERFLDPALGMIPDGGGPGAGYAGQGQSGDSALWTGIYLAGQVYRYQLTGNAKAKENVLLSLNAILTLQEITNDWKQFARVLRKAQGNPQPPWRAGTGQFAHLEWMEGGNNDMIKGLFYGLFMGWELLCEGGKTGHEAICARIRTNAQHLADDVVLGGSNAPASQLTNKLPAAWLAAVVTDDVADKLKYQATATGYWTVGKAVLAQTVDAPFQGQVDASGMNLSAVGNTVAMFLAKRMNLGGDAEASYRAHIDKSYENIGKFRLAQWDIVRAIVGTGAGNSTTVAPFLARAVSRLEEAVYPKASYNIDRRISPDFCMSPYPYQPWKNDWMSYPASDRTTGLNAYPLFESAPDLLYWKVGNRYRAHENYESAGSDYLHVYWQARKFGLLSATD